MQRAGVKCAHKSQKTYHVPHQNIPLLYQSDINTPLSILRYPPSPPCIHSTISPPSPTISLLPLICPPRPPSRTASPMSPPLWSCIYSPYLALSSRRPPKPDLIPTILLPFLFVLPLRSLPPRTFVRPYCFTIPIF